MIRVFLIFSFFLFSSLKASNDAFVTCELNTQFGNQLCNIAATLAFAWDNGFEPIFPLLNKPDNNTAFNRDNFFYKLNASHLPRPIKKEFVPDWMNYSPIPVVKDIYLKNFFFCWKYFHHHREKLLEIFQPKIDIQNHIKNKYAWLLSQPLTVAIHVRTYSKKWHETFMPFLGMDYYKKAMDLFPQDAIFVIFSDRINWCKVHFSSLNKNIIFSEGNNHIEDFYLMTQLKHIILGNSTYSWWAAYLNTNPEKIVVSPRYWFRPDIPKRLSNYIFFPDWKLVNVDFSQPYPEDMYLYDEKSKSVDWRLD